MGVRDHGTEKADAENMRPCGVGARPACSAAWLCAITQRTFLFIAHPVIKLLSLFEPAIIVVQAQDMDLFTAVTLVNGASACVKPLRTENAFSALGSLRSSSHRGYAGDRPRSEQEETHTYQEPC